MLVRSRAASPADCANEWGLELWHWHMVPRLQDIVSLVRAHSKVQCTMVGSVIEQLVMSRERHRWRWCRGLVCCLLGMAGVLGMLSAGQLGF